MKFKGEWKLSSEQLEEIVRDWMVRHPAHFGRSTKVVRFHTDGVIRGDPRDPEPQKPDIWATVELEMDIDPQAKALPAYRGE